MSEQPRLPVPEADEIDLRAWLPGLIRGWKLIVGITVLALVAAGAYTLLQPRLYEATAVLAAMLPAAVPQGQTPPDPQVVARTALEVALTDSVVSDVYDLTRPQLRNFRDRDELRRAMEGAAGRDPRTVRLVVRSPDAAEAAAVANAWARLVVVRVNDVYLGRRPTPASALSQANRSPGEAANPVLLQAQRDAAEADVKNLQAAVYGLEGLERDIQAFRDRVARGDGGTVPLEDQLTALFLQLRAFGVSAPERIEFGSDQLGSLTKDRQALLARLDDLSRAVAARKADVQGRLGPRRAEGEGLGRGMQGAGFGSGGGAVGAGGAPARAPGRAPHPRPAPQPGGGAGPGLILGLALVTAREALLGPAKESAPGPVVEQPVAGRTIP